MVAELSAIEREYNDAARWWRYELTEEERYSMLNGKGWDQGDTFEQRAGKLLKLYRSQKQKPNTLLIDVSLLRKVDGRLHDCRKKFDELIGMMQILHKEIFDLTMDFHTVKLKLQEENPSPKRNSEEKPIDRPQR